jgi:hypothetical protein
MTQQTYSRRAFIRCARHIAQYQFRRCPRHTAKGNKILVLKLMVHLLIELSLNNSQRVVFRGRARHILTEINFRRHPRRTAWARGQQDYILKHIV